MRTPLGALGVLSVLCSALVLLQPSSATAESSATSVASGVLFPGCREVAYSYSVTAPADSVEWTLSTESVDPTGAVSADDEIYSDEVEVAPLAGTSSFRICGDESAGVWTLRAGLETCDEDLTCTTEALPTASFTMREPLTRTAAVVRPTRARKGQVVKVTVSARDERPTGFLPTRGASVFLESRSHGGWKRVQGSNAITGASGSALVPLVHRGKKLKLRAVTSSTEGSLVSTSPQVTIR